MDIRRMFAEEIAEQIGAAVTGERCPKCAGWLIQKFKQEFAFCWGCVSDRETAQRGRTLLTQAKLAERGILIETHSGRDLGPMEKQPELEPEPDPWPERVPL